MCSRLIITPQLDKKKPVRRDELEHSLFFSPEDPSVGRFHQATVMRRDAIRCLLSPLELRTVGVENPQICHSFQGVCFTGGSVATI